MTNKVFIGSLVAFTLIVVAADGVGSCARGRFATLSPLARAELKIARAEHDEIFNDSKRLMEQINRMANAAVAPKLAKIRSICEEAGVAYKDYAEGRVQIDLDTGVISDAPKVPPTPPPTRAPDNSTRR